MASDDPLNIIPENLWEMYVPTHKLPKPQTYVTLAAPDRTIVENVYCYGHHVFGNFHGILATAGDYGPQYIKIIAGHIRQRKLKHFDNLIQITGDERAGKSTLAQQLAEELEPGFPLSRICFKIKDFNEAIETAPDGSVIIFDEAGFDLFNQEWWAEFQANLVKKLLVIGIKELIMILILPHRMDLNGKLRDRRVKFWINVFTRGEDYERGFALFRRAVGNEWQQEIYWEGLAAFRFGQNKGERWDAYSIAKRKFVDQVSCGEYEPENSRAAEALNVRDKAIYMMLRSGKFTQVWIADELKMSQQTISRINVAQKKKEDEKVNPRSNIKKKEDFEEEE